MRSSTDGFLSSFPPSIVLVHLIVEIRYRRYVFDPPYGLGCSHIIQCVLQLTQHILHIGALIIVLLTAAEELPLEKDIACLVARRGALSASQPSKLIHLDRIIAFRMSPLCLCRFGPEILTRRSGTFQFQTAVFDDTLRHESLAFPIHDVLPNIGLRGSSG